jgi:hypothetical protein
MQLHATMLTSWRCGMLYRIAGMRCMLPAFYVCYGSHHTGFDAPRLCYWPAEAQNDELVAAIT